MSYKILSVQVNAQFYKVLRIMAAEKDMSISALVRQLLEQALLVNQEHK